jgi:hypothetical protein
VAGIDARGGCDDHPGMASKPLSFADRAVFRLPRKEKVLYERAARQAGMKLSVWMRSHLRRAANRELSAVN